MLETKITVVPHKVSQADIVAKNSVHETTLRVSCRYLLQHRTSGLSEILHRTSGLSEMKYPKDPKRDTMARLCILLA
jgi:hypothetical protein